MRLSSSPMPTTWIRDRSGSRRLELFSAFHTNLPFPKANPKHVSDEMRWQIFSSTALPKLPSDGEVSFSKSAQSTVNRWNAVLQDEERYQSQNYPTSEDLPGCMSLMCALSPSLHPRQLIIAQGRLPHVLWSVPPSHPKLSVDGGPALVPQLRNLYRHGESRDCRWKWHDFKFCLSLKSESEEARRELWIKRRAEWWAARRVEGSSEDVWDRRKWVELLTPFQTLSTVRAKLMGDRVPLENFPAMYPEEIGVDEVVK